MSDAYEQIHNKLMDIWKTAFASIFGMFISNIMMQGDCNAPATFQRVMTLIFQNIIGKYIHVYLNNVFIFSNSIEEHECHICDIFKRLRKQSFFLKSKKCELFAKIMDCLGHHIDDDGIHADKDKMSKICDWHTPHNFNDVQRFPGLVQYVAPFMPDITTFMGPLSSMCRNNVPFIWMPLHQVCFENIKRLAALALILQPIDLHNKDPIWIICDTLISGIGCMYSQGPTWQTCPA
jgi:hypothetical protein